MMKLKKGTNMAAPQKNSRNERLSASDKVKKQREDLVSKLIENMKSGKLYWNSGWNTKALCPYNPVSNIKYKAGNRFKLYCEAMMKQYEDPRWCTFLQAKQMGWKIKPNESGILLEKWIFEEKKVLRDENNKYKLDKKGNKQYETIELSYPIVNYFYVFNASQLSGVPNLEQHAIKEEVNNIKKHLINSSECPVHFLVQDKSYYNPIKDEIVLPSVNYFEDEYSLISTLIHELAHSTGHESRLNRSIVNQFGSEEYAKEELRAELSSAFFSADLTGLDLKGKEIQNHSAYLQSWIKILENNPDELYRASKDAQVICDRLYSNYEKERDRKLLKNKDLSSLCSKEKEKKPTLKNVVIENKRNEMARG